MFDLPQFEIDREAKKVTVVNNRRLHQAIKSGSVLVFIELQPVLESLRAAAESADPVLGHLTEVLARILQATYLYHVYQWTLAHAVHLSAHATATASATASLEVTPATERN